MGKNKQLSRFPNAITLDSSLNATLLGSLTLAKVSGVSAIYFPAVTSDAGSIRHDETSADAAKMYFSVSDNSSTTDYFSFGSTPSGVYTEGARITSSGVLTATAATLTGALTGTSATFTAPNAAALSIRSGNTANYTYISLGRATEEATIGIPSATDQFVTGAATGDIAINSPSGSILLGIAGVVKAKVTPTGYFKASVTGTFENIGGLFHELRANGGTWSTYITNTHASNPHGLVILYPNCAPNVAGNNFIYAGDNVGLKFTVSSNGNVTNVNNSYGASSDIKLKENIVDTSPKLESLAQIRIVNYNLIGRDEKLIGVVAQELEEVFPGLVDETIDRDINGNLLETTTKSVKYSVFVPMLIKGLQEMKVKVDQLETELQLLKNS